MRASSALVFVCFLLVACSEDVVVDSAPATATVEVGDACVDDPLACPEGLTCWIAGDKATYRCHTSGSGQVGEACRNVAGRPSCEAGLTCYTVEGFDPVCTSLCGPSTTCAGGAVCQVVTLAGTSETIRACQPSANADAGS